MTILFSALSCWAAKIYFVNYSLRKRERERERERENSYAFWASPFPLDRCVRMSEKKVEAAAERGSFGFRRAHRSVLIYVKLKSKPQQPAFPKQQFRNAAARTAPNGFNKKTLPLFFVAGVPLLCHRQNPHTGFRRAISNDWNKKYKKTNNQLLIPVCEGICSVFLTSTTGASKCYGHPVFWCQKKASAGSIKSSPVLGSFLIKFAPLSPTIIEEVTAGSDEKTQRSPTGDQTRVLPIPSRTL